MAADELRDATAVDGVVERPPDATIVERRGADVEEHEPQREEVALHAHERRVAGVGRPGTARAAARPPIASIPVGLALARIGYSAGVMGG